jgi:16S rRNA (cytosine967-C5)-methyltransferase
VTPAARIQTSAELLDRIFAGEAAEKSLTGWARRSRFAGSGDRNAVRDLVYDALRCRRSYAWLGQGLDGRAVMLGRCRAHSLELDEIFSGVGYAPSVLSDVEREAPPPLDEAPLAVRCDAPDWVLPLFADALSRDVEKVLARMRERAPVFLRANTLKCSRDEAVARLTSEGFDVRPHILANTAIVVEGNARKLAVADSLRDGLVEFQDVSSQAIVDRLAAFIPDADVLDYCAGGGGKALAMAAHNPAHIVAHDINSARMGDIEPRAARAGANITTTENPDGTFDLVVCDVPCTGSGAWRRQPDAKWRLDMARLDELTTTQAKILLTAKKFVRPGGHLAYITCSFFRQENDDRISKFLSENSDWVLIDRLQLTPLDGGDGFFLAVLKASESIR